MTNAPPRHVLVVDDHELSRRLARLVLEPSGWQVDEACDGAQALAALASSRYDCVLLDISMPGMSGEAVCAQIRRDPALAGIRVVAYTAHAMSHERERMLAVGFDDIVTKPASMARLTEAVAGAA
jgi:CheY-like chemotaxis protein